MTQRRLSCPSCGGSLADLVPHDPLHTLLAPYAVRCYRKRRRVGPHGESRMERCGALLLLVPTALGLVARLHVEGKPDIVPRPRRARSA